MTARLMLAACCTSMLCVLLPAHSAATDPGGDPETCDFCGVWSLDHDATIALQDVALDHAELVYHAMHSMQFAFAFAPDGIACMRVERRGEVAVESVQWERVDTWNGITRVRNEPHAGQPREMLLAVDNVGRLTLRQPARLAEPIVFARMESADSAADWCASMETEESQ